MKPQYALPVILTAITVSFGLTVSEGAILPFLGAAFSTLLCFTGVVYILTARIPEGGEPVIVKRARVEQPQTLAKN